MDKNIKLETILKTISTTNLLVLMIPGIYEIRCISSNKLYIGETENLLARLGKHSESLTQNRHDCRELQKDWNQSGKEDFEFNILLSGEPYESRKMRLEKEFSLIKEKKRDSSIYNIDKSAAFTKNYRREIEIDGKRYKSVSEAVKDPNITVSATTLRRRLSDPKYPNYREIKRSSNSFSIEGKVFDTLDAIVEAGLANNRLTVGRRIKSSKPKWKDWICTFNYKS